MLARLLGFSVLVSGAGVSSVGAGASASAAVSAGAVSVTAASSVVSLAAGSGEASFFSPLVLKRPVAKPENDLRFSF